MKPTPIAPPIYRGTVFEFGTSKELTSTIGDHTKGFSYGRYDNPTVMELEAAVAALEGAPRGLAFASGMAAISTAVLALLPPGGRIVRQRELYGGTFQFFTRYAPRVAAEISEVPAADTAALEAAIARGADLVYLETPINPTLELVDLARVAAAAREHGAVTLVDNTFSTPLGQRPLDLGIDVSIHSATKYIGGHHDVVAGVLATSEALAETIWHGRTILGGVLSPSDAFLLLRGLRTLPLRWERSCDTAARLARSLADDERVARVAYPGLPGHPGHDLAKTQMRSFGAMLAFELRTDQAGTERFVDALRVVKRAGSLGGIESLVLLPAGTSHVSLSPEERAAMGVTDSLVRLSVGTESLEDLRADLERGFAAIAGAPA